MLNKYIITIKCHHIVDEKFEGNRHTKLNRTIHLKIMSFKKGGKYCFNNIYAKISSRLT